jgi:hypothetical protein
MSCLISNKALHRNFVTLRFTKTRELGRYDTGDAYC